MAAGPFYDLTEEQWREVRQTHESFCSKRDLGRPLLGTFNPLYGTDGPPNDPHEDEIVLAGPTARHAEMDGHIRYQVWQAHLLSQAAERRDCFPVLAVPRGYFGHSQRLAEPLGTTTVVDGHSHAQSRPSLRSLNDVWHLKPKQAKECPYLSRSLDVLRYFLDSTEHRYLIRHFVTTGPCDTVNYATGSTALLEGFYANPKAVHQLLRITTDIIIEHILACREIAGDRLISDHTMLLDGCYCICSEIRSLFSAEHYEEFEAPYLKEIGEAVGPLHIHISGPVEQSVPATLLDANIKHMRIWLRDSNLDEVAGLIGDQVSLDFFRNDCMPALSFESVAGFYRHIFENIRPETRWVIPHYEPEAFNTAYDELEREGTLPDQVRRFGRFRC